MHKESEIGREHWLKIELLSPGVFSPFSPTVGAHHCLDFIPGRILLGVAARLYSSLGAQAWTVFHSGKVRFGDALPWDEHLQQRARPTPLSLHSVKGAATPDTHQKCYNLAAPAHQPDAGAQYQQKRDDYLFVLEQDASPGGASSTRARHWHVTHSTFWKTAMDPASGSRPRESHLFHYDAINAGQCFAARVQFDADVDDALVELILDALCGRHHLGRSRTAEFGAAQVSRLSETPAGQPSAEALAKHLRGQQRVVIFLTSDLALADQQVGGPRLQPEPQDFGLPPAWRFATETSFVRFRSYDRYISFQATFEIHREVISRGSVLVFEGDRALNEAEISAVCECQQLGAGLDRQEGLGQFEVSPAWLQAAIFEIFPAEKPAAQADPGAILDAMSAPDQALLAFVSARQGPRLHEAERAHVQAGVGALRALYQRHADPFAPGDFADLPSASQWSNVRSWAAKSGATFSAEALLETLTGTHGQLEKGWQTPGPDGADALADWLVKFIENVGEEARKNLVLVELAKQVRENLRRVQEVSP